MTSKNKSAQDFRHLIDEYDIRFEALPPRKWPPAFTQIFQKIRDIEQKQFEQHDVNSGSTGQRMGELQLKRRARFLVDKAIECRNERANEATWRLKTGHLVLGRFNDQVVCRKCHTRKWIPEFQAPAELHHDAVGLEQRRRNRQLCECPPENGPESYLNTSKSLFSDRPEEIVVHDPSDDLARRGLSKQKPDRIFGLKQTSELQFCLKPQTNLRHSPFSDGLLSYPFLILEAKKESGTYGFSDVEDQTAFPIRTLLKIQQALQDASAPATINKVGPLVWFLANRGDEWRRVIDLWHASMLFEDRALQLLHIIDYICDWALNIYRPQILRWLRSFLDDDINAFDDRRREGTPTESNFWSQNEDGMTSQTVIPTAETFDRTSINLESDSEMQDAFPSEPITSNVPIQSSSKQVDISHPLLRFTLSNRTGGRWHWSSIGMIRHASIVRYSFVRLHVSENVKEFMNPFASLLTFNHLNHNPLLVDEASIRWLQTAWTGMCDAAEDVNPSQRLLARISYLTYFTDDWQVVRTILCVTASVKSLDRLREIACVTESQSPGIFEGKRVRKEDLEPIITRIRAWADPESVMASMLCLRWDLDGPNSLSGASELLPATWDGRYFRTAGLNKTLVTWAGPSEARNEVEWDLVKSNLDVIVKVSCLPEDALLPPHHFTRSSVMEEIQLEVSNTAPLFDLPKLPESVDRTGVLLLKKGRPWATDTGFPQRYCLIVFEESDFVDEVYLARKILKASEDRHVYVARAGGRLCSSYLGEHDRFPFDLDNDIMRLWANEVMGVPYLDRVRQVQRFFPDAVLD